MEEFKSVQELYQRLGIHNEERKIRTSINTGMLNNKLNANYSAIYGERKHAVYGSNMKIRN